MISCGGEWILREYGQRRFTRAFVFYAFEKEWENNNRKSRNYVPTREWAKARDLAKRLAYSLMGACVLLVLVCSAVFASKMLAILLRLDQMVSRVF